MIVGVKCLLPGPRVSPIRWTGSSVSTIHTSVLNLGLGGLRFGTRFTYTTEGYLLTFHSKMTRYIPDLFVRTIRLSRVSSSEKDLIPFRDSWVRAPCLWMTCRWCPVCQTTLMVLLTLDGGSSSDWFSDPLDQFTVRVVHCLYDRILSTIPLCPLSVGRARHHHPQKDLPRSVTGDTNVFSWSQKMSKLGERCG